MTLVQSHLQQLNGNKIFIILISLTIMFTTSSCDLFSDKKTHKTHQRTSKKKDKRVDQVPKNDKDVIVIDKDETSDPVHQLDDITIEIDKPHKKKEYAIDLLLPLEQQYFETEEEPLSLRNEFYIHFLLGAMMSIEEWNSKGLKVNLSVDKSGGARLRNYKNESDRPDIVIAGGSTSEISDLLQISAEQKLTVVSPFIPRSNVTTSNPYFIQAMPDLESYCEAMTFHALKNYADADYAILGPQSINNRFEIFQEAKAHFEGVELSKLEAFKEVILDEGSIRTLTSEILGSAPTQVIFIPLDRNKEYLYKLLSHLSTIEGKRRFIVYGIPPWDKFDLLFTFFKPLEVRLTKHASIYGNPSKFKEFEQEFYDQYGILPSAQAAYGYDLSNQICGALDKEGTPIYPAFIESKAALGTGSRWHFQPVVSQKNLNSQSSIIEYIRNSGILIID